MKLSRARREPRRGKATRQATGSSVVECSQEPKPIWPEGSGSLAAELSGTQITISMNQLSSVSTEGKKMSCAATTPDSLSREIERVLPLPGARSTRWRQRTEAIRAPTVEDTSCALDRGTPANAKSLHPKIGTPTARALQEAPRGGFPTSIDAEGIPEPDETRTARCPIAGSWHFCRDSQAQGVNALFAAETVASDPLSDPAELHLTNMAVHCCAEVTKEIYETLQNLESRRRPRIDYIESLQEPQINTRMRAILIDWLVEVAGEFQLSNETLHLSVCYLDRYLSLQPVAREVLQLLGMTCMLVAAKVEEITVPLLDDFVFISAETYTRTQMKLMESQLLQGLNFELCDATALPFWRRYAGLAGLDREHASAALFLCELALVDYHLCVRVPPSFRAAAAVWIASGLDWPATLSCAFHGIQNPRESGEIQFAATRMIRLWQQCLCSETSDIRLASGQTVQLRSIAEKYGHESWCAVAHEPPADLAFLLRDNSISNIAGT
ncbi:hypothetical protein CCYA_CCYA11G3069 [Cyanidiococcus yangmingshanensis]|nr:hypothetical protein CCYA_CCYA11G3069 [Cyanidiococcus yangmingshanensis]